MYTTKLSTLVLLLATLGLAACGGGTDAPARTDAPATGTQAVPASEPIEITITPLGEEMRYEQTEFTVRPGQQVRLIFNNTATSQAMHHNVVVVRTRDDINRVGMEGMSAGPENQYVPDDPAVLAYTPMAAPGETVEVTFTAPTQTGDYPYICTYPGHYALMQGTMRVVR
jgi:azurin